MKPLASLSLDLDNKWSYLRTHGDSSWETFPSYLPVVVPRILDILDRRGLRITFFVVGQDCRHADDRPVLRRISQQAHEIGNHSLQHQPWLHRYTEAELEAEIGGAEAAIEQATETRPRGFRGPGFSVSATLLRVLARRGYDYDASTFPTFLGPLARAYYLQKTAFRGQEQQRRARLFGTFADGLQSLSAYRWRTPAGQLLEIPVTTLPGLRLPMHVSYLQYVACFSPALARAYFGMALSLCRMTSVIPSLLLHPTDFLGREDAPELSFFPAMNLPLERKLQNVTSFLDQYTNLFRVVTLGEHACAVIDRSLPMRRSIGR
jgi:peptidoglycan-N-acetylglucosamine deacetylase